MKALLKSISTFRGVNLCDFFPEIPNNFHVLVYMSIGPDDQNGGHDYSLGICTPTWLDHNIQNDGPIWGRHLLVVNIFDVDEILASIKKIITQCERADWAETSVILSRFFAWEFEDYQCAV